MGQEANGQDESGVRQGSPDPAWEVFARHGREPALHHVGQVRATDVDDAVVFAYTLYDERRWAEMFVVEAERVTVLQEPE